MPVLARWIKAAGIPTVVVTMMPSVAEEAPGSADPGRRVSIRPPFGMPHDRGMQRRTLELAVCEAYRAWQPNEPSPIVRKMLEARRNS